MSQVSCQALSQTIFKNDIKNNYTQISNSILEDTRLTAEARWLLSYTLSKPKDWIFVKSQLCKLAGYETKKVSRMINELIKFGYLYYYQKNEKGNFSKPTYLVFESPDLNPYFCVNGIPKREIAKQRTGIPKRHTTNNNTTTNNKIININNKQGEKSKMAAAELYNRLDKMRNGCITIETAKKIVSEHDLEYLEGKVLLMEKKSPQALKSINNPIGFLLSALKNNYPVELDNFRAPSRPETQEEYFERKQIELANEINKKIQRENLEQNEIKAFGKILSVRERMKLTEKYMQERNISTVYTESGVSWFNSNGENVDFLCETLYN